MAEGTRPGGATAAGVLEIVFGALGAIGGLMGALAGALATAVTGSGIVGAAMADVKAADATAAAALNEASGMLSTIGPILTISSLLMLALGVVGLIAGIMLMASKKAGINFSQIYIWGSIAVSVITFVLTIVAGQGPNIVGLLLGAVVPVIIFILLANQAVKDFYAKAA